MILSFVQTKGGTAKSTLALLLTYAKEMRAAFQRPALVELDEQGTLKRWWRTRHAHKRPDRGVSFYHVSHTEPERVEKEMTRIFQEHDLVVLDVPGESVSKFHTNFACLVSDLVIIPMRTSTNDEEAFEANLLPVIDAVMARKPEREGVFHVLPTFVHPRADRKNLVGYFRQIMPGHIGCIEAVFPMRSVFENFNREGLTLSEYGRLVAGNRRESKQVKNAEQDVTAICRQILEGA